LADGGVKPKDKSIALLDQNQRGKRTYLERIAPIGFPSANMANIADHYDGMDHNEHVPTATPAKG
jgi:hypothetical protein